MWLLGLILTVYIIWGAHYDRLSPQKWSMPIAYAGDSLSIMTLIKAHMEGDIVPFSFKTVKRMGAPFQAKWDDFPYADQFVWYLVGLFGKFFGVFQATNFVLLFQHLSSALALYICCRLLRHRKEWAFTAALLFSFAYFHLWRQLPHISVALSYALPFAVLTCWLVGSSKIMRWNNRFGVICLLSSAMVGLGNAYNVNLFLQLMCFTLAIHFFAYRRKANLLIGLACMAITVAMFFLNLAPTLIYHHLNGANPDAFFRAYYQCELYGLKPLELIIPPTGHRFEFLAKLGRHYGSSAWFKGELFSPYLGLLAVGGLCWLSVECIAFIVKPKKRRFPVHMLHIIWVFLYSVVAGVNCLFGLFGLYVFRASNRYSILIAILILFFISSRMSKLTRKISLIWSLLLCCVALGIGLLDQLPKKSPTAQFNLKEINSDAAFINEIENQLPKGAMVFELPVMKYPEAPNLPQYILKDQYSLVRPYIHSKTLRFSHGNIKGRPEDGWKEDVERLAPDKMVKALEDYGFSAIYLCRNGIPDKGTSILSGLAALGRTSFIEDTLGEHVCVFLKPNPMPKLPPLDGRAMLIPKSGWLVDEQSALMNKRIAIGNAKIAFFNPYKTNGMFSLKCQIATTSKRHITLYCNNKKVWQYDLAQNQAVPIDMFVEAHKGNNLLRFETDAPPVPASADSLVDVSFILMDLKVTKAN